MAGLGLIDYYVNIDSSRKKTFLGCDLHGLGSHIFKNYFLRIFSLGHIYNAVIGSHDQQLRKDLCYIRLCYNIAPVYVEYAVYEFQHLIYFPNFFKVNTINVLKF